VENAVKETKTHLVLPKFRINKSQQLKETENWIPLELLYVQLVSYTYMKKKRSACFTYFYYDKNDIN
jgi:hypothetical protein